MSAESLTPVTKCEGCVFSKLEGGKQVDCDLARHEKLGFSTLSDETTFTLERFCNTYRPEEWISNLEFEDRLNIKEVAMKEVAPRAGFIIKLDHTKGDEIEDLDKTLASIKKIKTPTGKEHPYIIVVTEKVEYNEDIWGKFISYFGEDPVTKYHIVQLNQVHKNLSTIIDATFTHFQNGWVQCLTSGDEVPDNFLNKIHNFVNVEMKQIVMLLPKSDSPFSGFTFPAFLFKFLNGNSAKVFKDDMVDTRSFLNKVLAAEKRGGTKTVYTWEEFYAA